MSAPLLSLDPAGELPLYEQLYRALAGRIRAGELPAGRRLPGKRSLAEQLGVSVNTVDTAYQLLAAEGWLDVRPRSGFFVAGRASLPLPGLPQAAPVPAAPAAAVAPVWQFDCGTSGVDTGLFPFRTWGRIQKELLYAQPGLLAHGHPQGDEELRAAIADYLQSYRGVVCTPDQIVVGAGAEYLLSLLAVLLPGGPAALEDPGYLRPRAVLGNCGVACLPVPIDAGGMDLDALEASGARIAYVTPSHQFPTGVTMPAPRRAGLLAWAMAAPGRYILEDDYDSEFRFDVRPLPSLQGMAGPDGPVVYLSTFSKSLAPSIRIAYMVLPRHLLGAYRARFSAYASTVSRFEQQTLYRFMAEGHFTRHLARMRKEYRARAAALTGALESAFGADRLTFGGRQAGLHFLLRVAGGPPEGEMVRAARTAGVRLAGLSEFCQAAVCPPSTVVLGYGALAAGQAEPLAARLAELWR